MNPEEIEPIVNDIRGKLGNRFISNLIDCYGDSGSDYILFLRYYNRNKKPAQISKESKLNIYDVINWVKGEVPWSIRCFIDIQKKGFHNIPKPALARIIGWGLGDGGLDNRPHYYFLCGRKDELNEIRYFISAKTGLKGTITENKSSSGITKIDSSKEEISGEDTWILRITNTSFCVFLHALGLPKGQKSTLNFLVPKWILEGNKLIKREFLTSLFECELERFRTSKRKNVTLIHPPTFSMNKIEELEDNLKHFFQQVVDILKEFGVNVTKIDEPILSRIRADGKRTISLRFRISSSAYNVIQFSKTIDFRFNSDKRNQLKVAVNEAKKKISDMRSQLEKYKKAEILSRKGCSAYGISRELDISYATAKDWITERKHVPILARSLEDR